jgi:hypothetical protein
MQNQNLQRISTRLGSQSSMAFIRPEGDVFKRQVQTITAGVTRPKVTLSDFRKLRLARPLLDEQKLIDALLTRHENVLSANHQHLAKLRQQKQGLMHDLLTGRVRVERTAELKSKQ